MCHIKHILHTENAVQEVSAVRQDRDILHPRSERPHSTVGVQGIYIHVHVHVHVRIACSMKFSGDRR